MKLSYIIPFAICTSVNASWWGGQGGGDQDGGGQGGLRGQGGAGNDDPPQELQGPEKDELLFMREEEKMARDVYLAMHEIWKEPVFANIAEAEQTHMDRMLDMIQRYGLTDPVTSDVAGKFQNAELEAIYDTLVEQGSRNIKGAFMAGALIEEIDIDDLDSAIAGTEEATLDRVYGNLRRASMNHLRAFVRELGLLGEDYSAQYLSQAQVNDILN